MISRKKEDGPAGSRRSLASRRWISAIASLGLYLERLVQKGRWDGAVKVGEASWTWQTRITASTPARWRLRALHLGDPS
jgi:hypothetical protein